MQIPYFDKKTNTIHVDMDGVLADFDRFVLENMGRTFDHAAGPGADREMWDFLSKVDRLYYHLEPTPYMEELWSSVWKTGAKVEILTAIPRRTTMQSAEQDKRDWVAKHIGSNVTVKIGPFSRDKWKHARPGDILIDDRLDNIQDWINNGFGIGILHDYKDFMPTLSALGKHV